MSSPVKIITHDSSFHSDDVFAVATLVLMLGDTKYEITRTRDKDLIEKADYVVDVGEVYDADKNRFDHHQEGRAGQRDNGVPYASFGLVWKKFGEKVCGSKDVADKIDLLLVQSIDAGDNGFSYFESKIEGLYPYSIRHIINARVPTWKENEDVDKAFFDILDLAIDILGREIKIQNDKREGFFLVKGFFNKFEDNRILVLEDKLPWEEAVSENKEIIFVVVPKTNGSWSVETARDNINNFVDRKSLPKEWGGKRAEDLISITGVPDAVFCHTGLFVAFAKSKEGAIALAKLALEK
ncbi:MAG: MYG1 family protein [Candidatus Paceibacterota bacterium]